MDSRTDPTDQLVDQLCSRMAADCTELVMKTALAIHDKCGLNSNQTFDDVIPLLAQFGKHVIDASMGMCLELAKDELAKEQQR